MWTIGRGIVSAVLFSLAGLVGVASAQYNYPAAPQPPSQPTTQGTVYTVSVTTATVRGKREEILTDARGMALYYFTSDTPTKAACTGGCTKTWPPLLSESTPTHAAGVSGKLSVVNGTNDRQVSYNGHLLYTYSGDTTPGQALGDGLFGKWFVAKPGLAVWVSGSPRSAPDKGGGY